jgi:hypothetical protein
MQDRYLLKQILEATRDIWDRPGTRPSVRKNFAAVIDCGTAALGWVSANSAAGRLIKNHSSNHDARYNDFVG